METFGYYRTRIGVAPTEDRLRSVRRRIPRTQADPDPQLPALPQDGRRRWTLAGLLGLDMANRGAK